MSLYEMVTAYFDGNDWPYERVEGHSDVLRTVYEGKNGHLECFCQAREDFQQVLFYSVWDEPCPEARRPVMAEFVTRANYGMLIGNFELDYIDGEVRYKTSIDLESAQLTQMLIHNLVVASVMTMDRYLPGVIGVARSALDPVSAILQVEATMGGAEA